MKITGFTFLFSLGFYVSAWGVSIELSPNPGTVKKWVIDTADIRYFSDDWGLFSIHWSDPATKLDSVRFEIDSLFWTRRCPTGAIEGGIDSSRHIAWIRLNRSAYACLDSSLHQVVAGFRMNGIRMEAEWSFRLFLRQYWNAESILEIVREVDEPLAKEFKVASVKPIDTTLWESPKEFRFSERMQGRELLVSTRYSGLQTCCQERIDGVIGDTVAVFLHFMGHDSTGWQWQISHRRYDMLRDTGHMPFTFTEARSVLREHGLNVKLGPIFPQFGNNREAYAYPEGQYWKIQENTGSGDCIAGCISSRQRTFLIAAIPPQRGVCISTSPYFPSLPFDTTCYGNLEQPLVSVWQNRNSPNQRGLRVIEVHGPKALKVIGRDALGRRFY